MADQYLRRKHRSLAGSLRRRLLMTASNSTEGRLFVRRGTVETPSLEPSQVFPFATGQSRESIPEIRCQLGRGESTCRNRAGGLQNRTQREIARRVSDVIHVHLAAEDAIHVSIKHAHRVPHCVAVLVPPPEQVDQLLHSLVQGHMLRGVKVQVIISTTTLRFECAHAHPESRKP